MRHKIISYNPKLKELARYLRKNSTQAEIILWKSLRRKQMHGYDFDRQRPIDNYIVDFYCKQLMLAIEIDGNSHLDKEKYDKKRQERLKKLGVHLLVFSDYQVKNDIQSVLFTIEGWIKDNGG